MDRFDIVIARAFDIGREDGIEATGGWLYDLWKERNAGDEPEPDLSGEWADSPTPALVLARALRFAGVITLAGFEGDIGDLQAEVCGAYEDGFRHGRDRLKESETWRSVVASR